MRKSLEDALRESQELDAIYTDIARTIEQQANAWQARWPHYCRYCAGWGAFYRPANQRQPEDASPCEELPLDQCHRCGRRDALNADNASGPCRFCGWNYDDGIPTLDPY